MAADPTPVEQAVSRALRDNLGKLQRTADDLHQAVNDIVAACASSRPTNALPPMVRAQTAAASLAAALESLARFVTAALQSAQRSPLEAQMTRFAALSPATDEPPSVGAPRAPAPKAAPAPRARQAALEPAFDDGAESLIYPEPAVVQTGAFDVAQLPAVEQELHRRANRVAKVSMQDIKLLKPEQVRLGCEKGDLCERLRDEIEKAHKEYSRRFRPILGHPVDYFYHWMVEILADGNPRALGKYPYPYPSPARPS